MKLFAVFDVHGLGLGAAAEPAAERRLLSFSFFSNQGEPQGLMRGLCAD
jgi:hypothetical protein